MGRRLNVFAKIIGVASLYIFIVTSTTYRNITYFAALVSIGFFFVFFYVVANLGKLMKPEEETDEEGILPQEATPKTKEVKVPEPFLPSEIVCSRCGHVNPYGAEFCIKCGRQIE